MTRVGTRGLQAIVLAVVAAAGFLAYRQVVRPDRTLFVRLAEERLREIFGPDVTYRAVTFDLVSGVRIQGLEVRTPSTTEPTLKAERVEVRHDVVALASGVYRPETIVIERARIVTHETETGLAPDFPFTLEKGEDGERLPRIVVADSTLFFRAMEGSQRLRPGYVLVLDEVGLALAEDDLGQVAVRGSFRTRGLEQDDVRIVLQGQAKPRRGTFEASAVWDPFRLTPHVLDHVIAEPIASHLRGRSLDEGRLEVGLAADPDVEQGEVRVLVRWEGAVRPDVAEIPGSEKIDARTREQLQALLGPGRLSFEVTPEAIDIRGLATALGGGTVEATGRIEDDGEAFRLFVRIRGLRIEDPSIRRALGDEGAEIFDQFQATGRVDADVRITKEPGKDVDFQVDAILEEMTFRFIGPPEPGGGRAGFPYRVVDAAGTVRITPGRVEFGDVTGVGARTRASFTLRGAHRSAWTGGETGRILLVPGGADIRLTVEGSDVPVDRELHEAVAGSEFAGLLDTYRLGGVVDRIEIDVLRRPDLDPAAITEVKVSLGGDTFSYAKFPLAFDDVSGWVTMRRPILEGTPPRRGRVFAFDVRGTVDGAPARAAAEYRAHEERGRLTVEAEGVPIAGRVSEAVLSAPGTKDGLGAIWRFLDPRGRADVSLDVPLELDPLPQRVRVDLARASVRLDAERAAEPVELTDITGRIEAVGERVTLHDVRGLFHEVGVTLGGTVDGGAEGAWDLTFSTDDAIRLTRPLLDEMALLSSGESLLPEGIRIQPEGRMALSVRLTRAAGPEAQLRGAVTATKIAAALDLRPGVSVSVHGERMELSDAGIRVEGVTVEGPGIAVDLRRALLEERGVQGSFRLVLDRFEPGSEVSLLLPPALRDEVLPHLEGRTLATRGIELEVDAQGGLRVAGELTVALAPDAPRGTGPLGTVSFEPVTRAAPGAAGSTAAPGQPFAGRIVFRGFSFDPGVLLEDLRGTVAVERLLLGDRPDGVGEIQGLDGKIEGVTVKGLVAPLRFDAGILTLGPVRGTLAGGALRASLRAHTEEPTALEGSVEVDDFDVARVRDDLAPSGPPLAGRGRARIRFENRGSGTKDLVAEGTITVRNGNLGDLPVVANIFALVGGVLPGREPPKFERADVEFTLRDEVVRFRRLDLGGPLFDMPGKGTLDLTGVVDLTFTPDFVKSMILPGAMQLPVVGDILGGVLKEELFYAVRVRGEISSAEPEVVPLPPLRLGEGPQFEGTGVPAPLPRRVPRWFR
jgi:hypothetical protein